MNRKTAVNKSEHTVDMCNGPIFKKLVLFALPLIFSGMLQLMFNAADIIVVGRFDGDKALAAVGSTGSFIALVTNLFIGFSVGANVVVARIFGAKQKSELSRAVHTSMTLSIFTGIAMTVIGIIGAKQILIWMKTPDGVLELAALYVRIYFLGMTPMMIFNFGAAILRSVGDTKRPLYYLTAAGIINVLLNLLFVIVFKMGVAGVAIATAISNTVSALLTVGCLMREEGDVRLSLSKLGIDRKILVQIVKVGLPAGIQGMVFALSNIVIQSSVNLFGETVVAGNSAAANLEGFTYAAMFSIYQATLSFTGQNCGAGNFKRINKIVILSELFVIAVGLVIGNAFVLFGRPLLSIYTPSDAVINAGFLRLKGICHPYFLCGIMEILVGGLRGVGYSLTPMIISLVGVCGFRLLWISTVFQIEKYHNVVTIYASYPISWIIAALVLFACFVYAQRKNIRRENSISVEK